MRSQRKNVRKKFQVKWVRQSNIIALYDSSQAEKFKKVPLLLCLDNSWFMHVDSHVNFLKILSPWFIWSILERDFIALHTPLFHNTSTAENCSHIWVFCWFYSFIIYPCLITDSRFSAISFLFFNTHIV